MALVYNGMRCPLCGEPIDLENVAELFATTMVGLEEPLSSLDDAAAHSRCVDAWPLKGEFVEAYNAKWGKRRLAIDRRGHVYHKIDWTHVTIEVVATIWYHVVRPVEAVIRVIHPKPNIAQKEVVPCPHCGKALLTAKAQQCFQCGADWHNKTPNKA